MVRVGGPNPQILAFVESAVDLARKAPYDRNMTVINTNYQGILAAHGWTVRWTYTVPADHKFENGLMAATVLTAIATAGSYFGVTIDVSVGGGAYASVCQMFHYLTTAPATALTVTALFALNAGDAIRARTYSDDTVSHAVVVGHVGMEFDA